MKNGSAWVLFWMKFGWVCRPYKAKKYERWGRMSSLLKWNYFRERFSISSEHVAQMIFQYVSVMLYSRKRRETSVSCVLSGSLTSLLFSRLIMLEKTLCHLHLPEFFSTLPYFSSLSFVHYFEKRFRIWSAQNVFITGLTFYYLYFFKFIRREFFHGIQPLIRHQKNVKQRWIR